MNVVNHTKAVTRPGKIASALVALAGASALSLAGISPGLAQDSAHLLIANAGQTFPADVSGQSLRQSSLKAGTATAGSAPVLDPVETAALYYYARERQTERVDAEITRLQALYPGFVPPQNLYIAADRIVPDESNLWEMFANDDFTGIDAEIIQRKAADAAWDATPDFQSKLMRKKLRVRMKELTEAKDWLALSDLSASIDPVTETDVDLVWMSVDALSETGNRDGLARALRGLLTREGTSRLSDEHLVVTLQKALRDFPASEVRNQAPCRVGGGRGTRPLRNWRGRHSCLTFLLSL